MARTRRQRYVLPLLGLILCLPAFAQRGGGTGSQGGGPHIVATQPSGGCQSLDVLLFSDADGIHFFYCPGGNGEWTEQTYEGIRADAIAPVGDCNSSAVVYGILDGSFSKCLNGSWLNTLGIYADTTSGRTYLGDPDVYVDGTGMTVGSDPGDGHRSIWLQANTVTVDEPDVGYVAIGAVQPSGAGSERVFFRVNGDTKKQALTEDKVLGSGFAEERVVSQLIVNGAVQFASGISPLILVGGSGNLNEDAWFADGADATKLLKILLSGVTTGKSATLAFGNTSDAVYTFPTVTSTLATTSYVPATATALAANAANCSAGSYPLGVNAAGAAESCTVAETIGDSHKGTRVLWADGTEAAYDTGDELCAAKSLTCKQIAGTALGVLGTLVNCSTAQTSYFTAFCY